nr:hypothetical protein GCM10020092_009880 [Actinoplanes digitatis]
MVKLTELRPAPPTAAPLALAAQPACHPDPGTNSRPKSPKPATADPFGAPAQPDPAQDDLTAPDAPATLTRPPVPAGTLGVPIRLAEPAALRLLRPGDHVDLFRLTEAGQDSPPVAKAALVLDVTGADDPATGGLLLALTPSEAERTMTAAEHGYAVQIRPDG